eukprot:5869126-Pyramimonas_sp.AAC.1
MRSSPNGNGDDDDEHDAMDVCIALVRPCVGRSHPDPPQAFIIRPYTTPQRNNGFTSPRGAHRRLGR